MLPARRAVGAAALAALLLAGCGIETASFLLEAPILRYTELGNTLELEHDRDNQYSTSFLGYELYYRVYEDELAAETDRAAVAAAAAATGASPGSVLQKLNSLSFKTAAMFDINDAYDSDGDSDEQIIPAFPVKAAEADEVVNFLVTMSASSEWSYSKTVGAATATNYSLMRNGGSSFNGSWTPGISEDYEGTSGDAYFIVAFALAYSFDIATVLSDTSLPGITTVISMP